MDPFPLAGKDLPASPSLDGPYAIIHGVMGALRDLGEMGGGRKIAPWPPLLPVKMAILTIPGSFRNRFCFCGKPFGRGKGDDVQGVWVDRIQACTSTP
ncbi:MAG: hypothetical protein ACYCT9_12315 [Leptospirillum sp.]